MKPYSIYQFTFNIEKNNRRAGDFAYISIVEIDIPELIVNIAGYYLYPNKVNKNDDIIMKLEVANNS